MPIPLLEVHLTDDDLLRALRQDVRIALGSTPKSIHPRWRWDARGSELYELINDTPEYFAYRTERALLASAAQEIASTAPVDSLIELGAGLSEKTQLLFDAYGKISVGIEHFVPLDVSTSALRSALVQLAERYPDMHIHGLVADFNRDLTIAAGLGGSRRMLLFLGGTIGNLTPVERAGFFRSVHSTLHAGDYLLLGAGLVTDAKRLEAAYADSSGLCREFNWNILRMLNRNLNADFEPEAFEHVSRWNGEDNRIEVFLEASKPMDVYVQDLDLKVSFEQGELFQTDISAKFPEGALQRELEGCGFAIDREWLDPDRLHQLLLARRTA